MCSSTEFSGAQDDVLTCSEFKDVQVTKTKMQIWTFQKLETFQRFSKNVWRDSLLGLKMCLFENLFGSVASSQHFFIQLTVEMKKGGTECKPYSDLTNLAFESSKQRAWVHFCFQSFINCFPSLKVDCFKAIFEHFEAEP